jgi:hypothetical protein
VAAQPSQVQQRWPGLLVDGVTTATSFFFIFSFFFFSMLIFSQVFSAITEIKPKESNPNLLGSTFSEEPIGPYFLDNRISVKTEEPN